MSAGPNFKLQEHLKQIKHNIDDTLKNVAETEADIDKLSKNKKELNPLTLLSKYQNLKIDIDALLEYRNEQLSTMQKAGQMNDEYEELKIILKKELEKQELFNKTLKEIATEYSNHNKPAIKNKAKSILKSLKEENKNRDILKQRSLVPQQYVVVASLDKLKSLQNYKYLGTDGIQTCLGCIIYSVSNKACLLTHFDDRKGLCGEVSTDLNIRDRNHGQEKEILESISSSEMGENYINEHVNYIKAFLKELGNPNDAKVALIASSEPTSQVLKSLIAFSLRENGIKSEDVSEVYNPNQIAQSALVDIAENIVTTDYHEQETLDRLQGTIRVALNLPPEGIKLFHLENGQLIPQNIHAEFSTKDSVMISAPQPVQEDVRLDIHTEPTLGSRMQGLEEEYRGQASSYPSYEQPPAMAEQQPLIANASRGCLSAFCNYVRSFCGKKNEEQTADPSNDEDQTPPNRPSA